MNKELALDSTSVTVGRKAECVGLDSGGWAAVVRGAQEVLLWGVGSKVVSRE